ncbi:MAG TPA: hypothetical protein VH561_22095 [Micromonosporaceae bacterium]
MDAYPCPACGGVAGPATGCRRCGRPHDPQAAALAILNRRLAELDRSEPAGAAEWQRLQAEAEVLRSALRRQLAVEAAAAQRTDAPPVRPAEPQPVHSEPGPQATEPLPATTQVRAIDGPPPPDGPRGVPRPRRGEAGVGPTASSGGRNAMLALGGVLLGIPAAVLTVLSFRAAPPGGRVAIIGVATLVALVVPLILSRRTLTATAETLAGLGLFAVLLDGYFAYTVDIFDLGSTPLTLYSSVLCGLVAAIAAAYRLASHLRAPQFATLLAVQPVLPLLATYLGAGRNGFGLVFAVVAALNLGSVELLGRDPSRALRAVLRLPGLAPGPGGQPWPLRLREFAWVMLGATLCASAGLASAGLLAAHTTSEAWRPAAVLLLAAVVGLAAGLLARRPPFGHVGGGALAVAVIVSLSRVGSLQWPSYALVLSAGVAAIVAIACAVLPRRARAGPRWGSLLGAGLTTAMVLAAVLHTTVQTVRMSLTPQLWDADLGAFANSIGPLDGMAVQVPAAAALLTVLAIAAVPRGARVDALVSGLAVVTLGVPGTGAVPWWGAPLLACATSTVAIATAVPARKRASAAVRAGAAGVLGAVAIATSLARPGLTAATCALVTVVALATVLVAVAARPGPHASPVADWVAGVGICTLPAAVGSAGHLADVPVSVLIPLTLLAAGIGVAAAMLAQVAGVARATSYPGSATGATVAAAGGVLLALRVPGTTPADLAVAALLAAAAVVAVTGRTAGTTSRLVDPTQPPAAPRLWSVDGPAVASALATAAVVLALARIGAVLVPGIGLVTTTAMVLVVALGVAALPQAWRPGPRLGIIAVGAGAVAVAAGAALVEAGHAVVAGTPYWHADLAAWSQRVSADTPYGTGVPVSLLLAALAAALLLPRPANIDVFFVLVCLGALAVPAVIAAPWWSAPLIAGGLAGVAGTAAALTRPNDAVGTHQRRLGLAGVLAAYAVASGSPFPAATAAVLAGLAGLGVIVAGIGAIAAAPPSVPGIACATALAAAPGSAACTAVAHGADRIVALGFAVGVCALSVVAVAGLRMARIDWYGYPGAGVGAAALGITAAAAVPDPAGASIWAATCALFATVAAGHSRRPPIDADDEPSAHRVVVLTLAAAAIPAGLFAAAVSTPAWVTALVGPFRTLQHVWGGYAPLTGPREAATALVTLLVLAPTSGGIALILGGRRYLLAALLPPLAAAAVVLPYAFAAPRVAVPWVALSVALATGLGAALHRSVQRTEASWLHATAGLVCAVTGAAGFADSLATRGTTLAALGALAAGALTAALAGRDPLARAVAWCVFATAGLALPPTAFAAAGGQTHSAVFGMFGVCGVLVGFGLLLSRCPTRRADATVAEVMALLGAAIGLGLSFGSIRYTSAALTICGLLLGLAALRGDRKARARAWLVRFALCAELAACWLLLYGLHIGLPEAYTLPFAAVALLAGALEQRRSPHLSSWLFYGPGLGGAFLPSLALILVGQDPPWRWAGVFLAAVTIVIVGSLRGWRAPLVTGFAIAVVVAIVEMVSLLIDGHIVRAVLVGCAGVILIVFGAFTERNLRRNGRPAGASPS